MTSPPTRPDLILIGTTDAGRILDVSNPTVIRLALSGELPYVGKLRGKNGALIFDRLVVLDYAARRAEAETTKATA